MPIQDTKLIETKRDGLNYMNYIDIQNEIDKLIEKRSRNNHSISLLQKENNLINEKLNKYNKEIDIIILDFLLEWVEIDKWITVNSSMWFDSVQTSHLNIPTLSIFKKGNQFRVTKINQKSVIIQNEDLVKFRVPKHSFRHVMISDDTIKNSILTKIKRHHKLKELL